MPKQLTNGYLFSVFNRQGFERRRLIMLLSKGV
jgi:hypothetical protein